MAGSLDRLKQIWNDRLPNGDRREYSLIEKFVCTVVILVSLLSFANYAKPLVRRIWPDTRVFMDLYVLTWFVLLCVFLGSRWNPAGNLVTILVVYRIVDIVNYRLLFLFVKSETEPWTRDVIRRSLAIALTNFLEVIVGFAILYLRTGSVTHGDVGVLNTPLDALYFSFVTMTTVGYGDFVPATTLGRCLVVAQLAAAILFVIFLLPALISVFSPALASQTGTGVTRPDP